MGQPAEQTGGHAAERPFLIGLSGPIGCGKSTVAQMLADVGGTILDADVLARRATGPGTETLPHIRERFGDAVFQPDGALDRAALAGVVFNDPEALADLERIVHPQVRRLVEAALDEAAAERAPFVVLEAIKLVEGGLADRCDEVWLVECSPTAQRERLAGRGLRAADIDQRIGTQGEGLGDRLVVALDGRVPVRRLPTEETQDETRELVETMLADALERILHGNDAPNSLGVGRRAR